MQTKKLQAFYHLNFDKSGLQQNKNHKNKETPQNISIFHCNRIIIKVKTKKG